MRNCFVFAALAVLAFGFAASNQAALRVALMDFSTDDNSYRSIQRAADFTSLVQVGLEKESDIEWVERSQIHLARAEFALAAMNAAGGESGIKRGRMLGAQWLVTGHFSTDDQERPTLSLQLVDVEHSDLIASGTILLSDGGDAGARFGSKQAEAAVAAMRRLLQEGKARTAAASKQARLAFLFLADVTRFPGSHSISLLDWEFRDALERETVTNIRVRLVEFPKAYQSTGESELSVDGIIEASGDSWKRIADLYVWGTYMVTNARVATQWESRLVITLNFWDGVSQPSVMNETLNLPSRGNLPPEKASELIRRLARQMVDTARMTSGAASAEVRRQIANSIVKAYIAQNGPTRQEPGLAGPGVLAQAVQMLETACFFDPDNADARVLWITCRYGWWVDFGFDVKNQFWTKWRRSQAWGNYVERFGFKPPGVELPFPYGHWGIPSACLRASEDVIKLCPENFNWSESDPDGPMKEAQHHGFPKDISNSEASAWKSELQNEHWNRLSRIATFISSGEWTFPSKQPPTILSDVLRGILADDQPAAARLFELEQIWPECVKFAKNFGRHWIIGGGGLGIDTENDIINLCALAGQPEKAAALLNLITQPETGAENNAAITNSPEIKPRPMNPDRATAGSDALQSSRPAQSRTGAAPAWLKNYMSIFDLFRLYPPKAPSVEIKPDVQKISFPSRYEVKEIQQLVYRGGQLWILAKAERSASSSDSAPDLSAETRDERSRLWRLEPNSARPKLYKPDLLPAGINSLLFQEDQLWLAGDTLSVWDLRKQTLQKFGLGDGLTMKNVEALTIAGGHIVAAGGWFEISSFEPAAARWSPIAKPVGHLGHGNGNPFLLAGNEQTLGYGAGDVFIRNFKNQSWKNLPMVEVAQTIAVDGATFWIGAENGLHRDDCATGMVRSWPAPKFIEGPMLSLMGGFQPNPAVNREQLEAHEARVQGRLSKLETDQRRVRVARLMGADPVDPFRLSSRIGGTVKAMANDGDFLWLGVNNYFGSRLLLLHKPSHALVAAIPMETRNEIASLAVSDQDIWIGTHYGDDALVRISKDALLAVPRSQWLDLSLTPAEKEKFVSGMSQRDQALYAFYAGDDERVVQLLGGINSEKASLEEMFILAWSSGAFGTDDLQSADRWFNLISERYPDSPWAKTALQSARANDSLYARFDRNHNRKLDASEKREMLKDKEALGIDRTGKSFSKPIGTEFSRSVMKTRIGD